MKTNRILGLAAVALAFAAGPPRAHAASNPKVIQMFVKCGEELDEQVTKKFKPPRCEKLGSEKDGWVLVRLDWYSGNRLLFQELGPAFRLQGGKKGELHFFLDGNSDPAKFAEIYEDPATTIFTQPDLHFQIVSYRSKKEEVIGDQEYHPVTSALWAKHSEDSAGLQADLDAETARAKAAEAQLGADIAAERAARIAGDNSLRADLNAEINRATAAETALSTRVDDEAAARQQADANLQTTINNEVAARQQGDANLQAALNAEILRATNTENNITNNLNAEIARAVAAEATISNNLTNEVMRAQMAEANLAANLNAEVGRAQAAEMAIMNNLNNEIARAKAVETQLANDLAAEAARAQAAEVQLANNLNAEIARAQAAEQVLTNNLNNEVMRAQGAETQLNNALNAEVARAQAAEAALAASLNNEITRAQAAEAAESSARTTADQNLGLRINLLANDLAREAITARSAEDVIMNFVTAEIATRAAENTALNARLNQEIADRVAAIVWPRSCPVGQVPVSTGNGTWGCGPGGGGALPVCPVNTLLVSTGGGNYACRTFCNGGFIDTVSDINNCGACGQMCSYANASGTCANSSCSFVACNANFQNCDGNVNNGCESNRTSDSNNCGGCGTVCQGGNVCVNSACVNNPLLRNPLNGSDNMNVARGSTHNAVFSDPVTGKVYWMPNYSGQTLVTEFNNRTDFQNNVNGRNFNVAQGYEGTYHAALNGFLYYNIFQTSTMVKVSVATGQVVASATLQNAGVPAGHTNQSHFNWGGYSDICFYTDVGGTLWVLSAPPGGNMVLNRLDPNTLAILQTFNIARQKTNTGFAFMARGKLYVGFNYSTPTINAYLDTANGNYVTNYNNPLTPVPSDYITDVYYDYALNGLWEQSNGRTLFYPNL